MKKQTRFILLAGLLTIGGAASVWVVDAVEAQDAALPADAGDLSNASSIEVKDGSGATVLSGHFVEVAEDDDDVERKAELKGSGASANASGTAEVEVSKTNNRIDQEVEVSVENLVANVRYSVHIDGKLVGALQTNTNGKGELELTTPQVK